MQRQKFGTKERVTKMCKAHTFTQFRMHDIQEKQNCEGPCTSVNAWNKKKYSTSEKIEDIVLWTRIHLPTASRNGIVWERKTGKGGSVYK